MSSVPELEKRVALLEEHSRWLSRTCLAVGIFGISVFLMGQTTSKPQSLTLTKLTLVDSKGKNTVTIDGEHGYISLYDTNGKVRITAQGDGPMGARITFYDASGREHLGLYQSTDSRISLSRDVGVQRTEEIEITGYGVQFTSRNSATASVNPGLERKLSISGTDGLALTSADGKRAVLTAGVQSSGNNTGTQPEFLTLFFAEKIGKPRLLLTFDKSGSPSVGMLRNATDTSYLAPLWQ